MRALWVCMVLLGAVVVSASSYWLGKRHADDWWEKQPPSHPVLKIEYERDYVTVIKNIQFQGDCHLQVPTLRWPSGTSNVGIEQFTAAGKEGKMLLKHVYLSRRGDGPCEIAGSSSPW